MRRAVVALLLAAAVVVLSAAPRASAAIEKPLYAKGDTWTYRSNLTDATGLRFLGNSTITAGDVVPITIQGETVEALELGVVGRGTFGGALLGVDVAGNWTVSGSEHWETGAWNSVRSFVRLQAEGTVGGPAPGMFTLTLVNETTRMVASETFAWPIQEGTSGETHARWQVRQNITITSDGGPPAWNESGLAGNFTTTYAQDGTAVVAVPAGTFATFRIVERGPEGGSRERWFAPAVGSDVRAYGYNDTGARIATSELVTYRYQAAEPPPPFPWLAALVAGLAGVVLFLVVALGLRRRSRKPEEVWMPPEEPGSPPPSP